MSLTSTVSFGYRSNQAAVVELANLTAYINENRTVNFADGTADSQCDKAWSDQATIANSGTTTYDLTALFDAFGVALAFAKIRAIIIENLSTTQTLTVGNAASNAFSAFLGGDTETIKILPNSQFILTGVNTGMAVSGSHKSLKIANGSAGDAANVNIWIVGTSA